MTTTICKCKGVTCDSTLNFENILLCLHLTSLMARHGWLGSGIRLTSGEVCRRFKCFSS